MIRNQDRANLDRFSPIQPVSPKEAETIGENEPGTVNGSEDMEAETEETVDKGVKVARRPVGPTREERETHEATHFPYRSWCPSCVRGRGIASPHRSGDKEEDEMAVRRAVIAMDYFYMNTKDEPIATLLAMKAHLSCQAKGSRRIGCPTARRVSSTGWATGRSR